LGLTLTHSQILSLSHTHTHTHAYTRTHTLTNTHTHITQPGQALGKLGPDIDPEELAGKISQLHNVHY